MAHKYRVSGGNPVLGYQPGDEFSADIPAEQEAQLIAGGAIEPFRKVDGAKDKAKAPAEAAGETPAVMAEIAPTPTEVMQSEQAATKSAKKEG